MKVYVVTGWYGPAAVFSTRKLAERYIDSMESRRIEGEGVEAIELEVDPLTNSA